jgi:hypothetical protein
MFDPIIAGKMIIDALNSPAIAELTAIAGIVVSAVLAKKPDSGYRVYRTFIKKI